ncbi:Leucine-rich repeat-containing protein 1 [Tetrabaena socialis]|uniref:Leucine-rich repeat-containing protein 1 n=1 Tax=Tetrabaena socialis TaxID=47790 RepID=A0A2J8A716_9CHLO|nr:Leucine-rich repeat-containing protein 1 [Tetrabaena socialis]|eukprot:PNH08307.1 Leucine-rich repeat-containing protein 1 [Tetrabaena socialis]
MGRLAVLALLAVPTAAGVAYLALVLDKRNRKRLAKVPAQGVPAVDGVVRSLRELAQADTDTVVAVELRQPGLTSLPMDHLSALRHLVRLDVGGCGLTRLPGSISTLRSLQVLLAPRNRLGQVPPELGLLSSTLVQLDLGANQLATVPSELCQLTGLRSLNLMGNQLERLPEDFGRLTNLRLLGLKSNKLVELPSSFSQLTALVELFITDNKLLDLPEGERLGRHGSGPMGHPAGSYVAGAATGPPQLPAPPRPLPRLACLRLPRCLLHLPRLEMVRVAVCAITRLPPALLEGGALPSLAWFSVAGNPVCPDPPPPAPGLPLVAQEELELGQKLGEGASGDVFRAVWRGQLVAVKFFRADVSPDGRTEDEVALAVALQHPHLTQVLARVERPAGLVLRLETGVPLALKPTSQHLLRCKWADELAFQPRRALSLALAVADALRYCHAGGVCHGDVYAHNVLMDEDGSVTLCDFGASFSYDPAQQPFWQAMEVRAYGLFLRDVAHRCDPSPEGPAGGAGDAPSVGAALRRLAERCTELPPAERPSFGALCEELRGL